MFSSSLRSVRGRAQTAALPWSARRDQNAGQPPKRL